MSLITYVAATVALCAPFAIPCGARQETPDAASAGISAAYPGDVGIAKDESVLFAEDFEDKSLKSVFSRWTEVRNGTGMSLVEDGPKAGSGKTALEMTRLGGNDTGGHLWKRLDRMQPPRDRDDILFLRYYIKLGQTVTEDGAIVSGTHHHTGGGLAGVTHDHDWPLGRAAIRPTGGAEPAPDNRFSVRIEPNAGDAIDFYTYWMGMHHNESTSKYYGNRFIGDAGLHFERGRWTCVELMVKLNNPVTGQGGELCLWIDGKLVSELRAGYPQGKWLHDTFLPLYADDDTRFETRYSGHADRQERFPYPMSQAELTAFEGFQWRDDASLNLNVVSLAYYTTRDVAGRDNRVWYDHVVLATSYIGPVVPR